jgi:NADH-quinone oxidoreductase subunit L
MTILYILIFGPLISSMIIGILGDYLSERLCHSLAIIGLILSFLCSLILLNDYALVGQSANITLFSWANINDITLEIGFLVDSLSLAMASMITFVSLAVHVYTIGYMYGDAGYKRFFSYISLFTFSMLMLVFSNNLLQLFFGWEAVGLVSYLLIGFWYTKPSAIHANMKAFIVNRVGDFGFLIGIATLFYFTKTLNLSEIFVALPSISGSTVMIFPGSPWMMVTFASICLFIGAMGKSAQMPLHVWLPDSMEGPTPISALIHAATMVTAGIFMVARMSPLFELSNVALSVIVIVGSTTALLMGLMGLIQNDIKRVVAYSTLSQLGYMVTALGVSAYSVGVYHLITHGFFKALLFLAAGSVIMALHHEQDIRQMGGLRKVLPITYATFLIGTLSLIGFPGFSGFFSKDTLIESVHLSNQYGAHFAYYALLIGVLITTLYSMRLLFVVFHGKYRSSHYPIEKVYESPKVVTWPLIFLAIPSIFVGAFLIKPMVINGFFNDSVTVLESHYSLHEFILAYHGNFNFILHAFVASPALYIMLFGVLLSVIFWYKESPLLNRINSLMRWQRYLLENKYFFDFIYEHILSRVILKTGNFFSFFIDGKLIDQLIVLGSSNSMMRIATVIRRFHTGDLTHYAFIFFLMIVSLIGYWML